ncbi:MAG: hypothetical protein ACOY94_09905 [Bacillota bacterium]
MVNRAWASSTPYARCLMGAILLSAGTLLGLLAATVAGAGEWVFVAIGAVGLAAIGYAMMKAEECR